MWCGCEICDLVFHHLHTHARPIKRMQNIDLESLWRAQQEEGKELDMDAFWDHVQVCRCILMGVLGDVPHAWGTQLSDVIECYGSTHT